LSGAGAVPEHSMAHMHYNVAHLDFGPHFLLLLLQV